MVKKTKILYLITKSNFGGAQKYVYDLATSLPSEEFEVVVALGGTGKKGAGPGRLKTILGEKGIRTIFIKHFTRDIYILSEIFGFIEVLKILWKERPDVLHVNSSKAGGIGSFWGRILGIKKIIYTVHGWPFNELRPWYVKVCLYFFSWLSAVFATDIITINDDDFHQGKQLPLLRKKIHKIYNGLRPTPLISKREALEKINNICGLTFSAEDLLLGTIAELHPNKGLPFLIESLVQAPAWKLIIIGEGEEREHLVSLIRTLHMDDRVFLVGFVPEASRLLPAFDAFVLPSVKEGQPYAILEAGLAGLPVVGSDIPGIRGVLGDKGILVPLKDMSFLVVSLQKLAAEPETRIDLGNRLRRHVETEFNFEKTLAETINLYHF